MYIIYMNTGYYYDEDVDQIDKIEFGILPNSEIKKISVLRNSTGVTTQELYDHNNAKKNGLNDPRFGATPSTTCETCKLSHNNCDGHFGHIELEEYVFHKGFILLIHKLLTIICINCAKPLIYKNEKEVRELIKVKNARERLNLFKSLSKGVTYCQHPNGGCGVQVPKIKLDHTKQGDIISVELESDASKEENKENNKPVKYILTPAMVYIKFKAISDDDCMLMGFNPKTSRPENMIHKNLPVPPIPVRPSMRGEYNGGSTAEDDLTKFLVAIVKANTRLINQKTNDKNAIHTDIHAHLLRFHVNCYIDNETTTGGHVEQNGMRWKSLGFRLKGKEGRVRGNLEGKRVNFTGRTVITPEPTIDNNELRVPVKIAMTLTFPERVTNNTIKKLQTLVKRGRYNYPGANFVFQSGRKFPVYLGFRDNLELKIGDIVERHMVTGDMVLVNRQPTLHKQSMMGHKIVVINDHNLMTFGLPLSVCKPYNADFDGDEMNIFAPQSIQTQIELEEIAAVEHQIISPTNSKTIIGLIQDALVGSFNLTSNLVKIDHRSAMNIMSYTSCDRLKDIKDKKFYTGHELVSLILPTGITIEKSGIKIKNGKIEFGKLTKDQLGSGKNTGLIQLIWDAYGPTKTQEFIDNMVKIANNFNLYNGFSVGVSDAEIAESLKKQINDIIATKELEIEHLITEHENNPSMLGNDIFEKKIFSELGEIRHESSKIVVNAMKNINGFKVMFECGSKGTEDNICQWSGTLAHQAFEGKLVPKKYNGRTSAYYHQNDDRGPSRGLVKNSFFDGLEFSEFSYHMLAARLGLIETTIKTAESGYAQRRLFKAMEDVMIKNDCTLRTANDMLLQICYGNSGADTIKQFPYEIKMIEMSNSEIEKKYKFTEKELLLYKDYSEKDNNKLYNKIIELRDRNRENISKSINSYQFCVSTFMLPVNLKRIVDSASSMDVKSNEKLNPTYIIREINKLLLNINTPIMCMKDSDKYNSKSIKFVDEQVHKKVFKFALYDAISPKRVLLEYGMNKEQFDKIIEDISNTFQKNMAEPGEMIGGVSAESAGEPLTQFTLKSFHTAGISSVSATTQGMPRIKELLSVSKNPKTPQMTIYLKDDIKTKKDLVHKIASYIKYTTLGEVRQNIDVYYDPDPKAKGGIMEKDNVKELISKNNTSKTACQHDIIGLPWLIRIEIDRQKMVEKEVTLLDIKSTFCAWWEKRFNDNSVGKKEEKKLLSKITQLAVLTNSGNDKQPVVHIRFNAKNNDKSKDMFNRNTLESFVNIILEKFKLKGLGSISNINGIPKEIEISFDKKTGEKKNTDQYVIYAAGIDLIGIRYINGIDVNKTMCNDVVTMYNTYGIEIARHVLINEFMTAYENANGDVNYQHICTIGDLMTSSGTITSIDRHGMGKTSNDPLPKASFEKTVEQLLNAAVFGEVDHMKSVSSRIMAGSVIKGGTGFCDLILNTKMIQNSKYNEEYSQNNDFIKLDTLVKNNKNEKNESFVPSSDEENISNSESETESSNNESETESSNNESETESSNNESETKNDLKNKKKSKK